MKNSLKISAIFIISITMFYACKSTPPLAPGTDPTATTLTMKTYPAGSIPTIRPAATGYIISYYDHGDMWLMKTDAAGDCVWARSYMRGATFMDYVDEPYGVAACLDGYYMTGDSHPFGGGLTSDYHDFIALKTDLDGVEVWRRTIDDKGSFGAEVIADTDGGIFTFVTNTPSLSTMLIKYKSDSTGDTVWSKTMAMPVYEIPALLKTATGFFLSNVNSLGLYTQMLSSAGVGGAEMNYATTGTLAEMGPGELPACKLASGGYITVRSYTPAGGTKNDVGVLKSGSDGAIGLYNVFGRVADDEIVSGVAESGSWTLVPVNINDINGGAYLALIDTADLTLIKEISLPGVKRVSSIITGTAAGEFIIVCSSDNIDMIIMKITVE